jgi:hypothetical protein
VRLSGGDYETVEGVGSIVPIVSLLVQVDGEDGTTTVDLTVLGLETGDAGERDEFGNLFQAISGNTVALAQEMDWLPAGRDDYETWIITFDDLPA